MNQTNYINKSSGGGEQDRGNTLISSFVMPPITEARVSRLFLSLNVQKSSSDVPSRLNIELLN